MAALDSYFKLSERGSTIITEIRAGTATFLTLCYILAGSHCDRNTFLVCNGHKSVQCMPAPTIITDYNHGTRISRRACVAENVMRFVGSSVITHTCFLFLSSSRTKEPIRRVPRALPGTYHRREPNVNHAPALFHMAVNARLLSESGGPCECSEATRDDFACRFYDQEYDQCVENFRRELITVTAVAAFIGSFLMG